MTAVIYWVFGLFCLDLILSHIYIGHYRKQFPKGDWTLVEANPVIRYFIRRLDLDFGMIVGGIAVAVILALILRFTGHHFHFFLAGVYYMMCTFHFLNFMALKRLRKLKGGNKNGKKEKRNPRRRS